MNFDSALAAQIFLATASQKNAATNVATKKSNARIAAWSSDRSDALAAKNAALQITSIGCMAPANTLLALPLQRPALPARYHIHPFTLALIAEGRQNITTTVITKSRLPSSQSAVAATAKENRRQGSAGLLMSFGIGSGLSSKEADIKIVTYKALRTKTLPQYGVNTGTNSPPNSKNNHAPL